MKRGVIQISNQQIKIISNAIATTDDELLKSRFKHKSQLPTQLQAELSEDQAETILDNLPMPDKNEDNQTKLLRKTLQQFLIQLRD